MLEELYFAATQPCAERKGGIPGIFDAKGFGMGWRGMRRRITNVKCSPRVIDGTLGTAPNRSISIRRAELPS